MEQKIPGQIPDEPSRGSRPFSPAHCNIFFNSPIIANFANEMGICGLLDELPIRTLDVGWNIGAAVAEKSIRAGGLNQASWGLECREDLSAKVKLAIRSRHCLDSMTVHMSPTSRLSSSLVGSLLTENWQ